MTPAAVIEKAAKEMAEAEGLDWASMKDSYSLKWSHEAVRQTWIDRAERSFASLSPGDPLPGGNWVAPPGSPVETIEGTVQFSGAKAWEAMRRAAEEGKG